MYYKKLFDEEKATTYNKAVKNYLDSIFTENTALVDIGYSGRTQEMIYRLTGKKIDGFYVHKNNDDCFRREMEYGFEILSFYDFTPSITGAQRELFFSALDPSCIGYSIQNKIAKPMFEESAYEYPITYLVEEMQKSAINFVKEYYTVFGKYITQMAMRNFEISYPFEHMLAYLEQEDLKLFNCVSFEDDMWAGGTIYLPRQWSENIRYHKLHGYYKNQTEYAYQTNQREYAHQTNQSQNYAWKLYNQKGMNTKKQAAKIYVLVI